MAIPQEIIFESREHYDLFCALFPAHHKSAHLASESLLSFNNGILKSHSDRLIFLSQQLTSEEQRDAEKYLQTLEQLRLSLILTHEQIDFCFSLLYPTPKNLRLKQLLHFYLDSPLKEDLAHGYWQALSHLKEQPNSAVLSSRFFVKAKSSTYLFSEWAQAHSSFQGPASFPIEFWEIPGQINPPIDEPGIPKVGPAPEILSRLAKEVASNTTQGHRQLVAFGGAPHALLYFESKLASLRVPFESLFSQKHTSKNAQPVVIAPLQAVPHLSNFIFWSYIDESFFAAKESLLLTEPELFTLMNGGFSIPRLSTDRQYLKTVITELQKPGKKPVYLSNSTPPQTFSKVEELPPTKKEKLKLPTLTLPPRKPVLSATQLETFSNCPTQYLVRHRLKLRPIQSLEERYPLIFGTAVHAALEQYFKVPGSDLTDLFSQSLFHISEQLNSHSFLLEQMNQQFQVVKTHFLELEKNLKERFGLKENSLLESKFELDLEGFVFSGKIDRAIETLNKTLLLIDYKTGTVDFSPTHISTGKNSQALLYVLAVRQQTSLPCLGIVYYDLKKGELRKGIINEDLFETSPKKEFTRGHVMTSKQFEELLLMGTDHLIKTSKMIESGIFKPTPKATECERCEAPTFCRQGVGYV